MINFLYISASVSYPYSYAFGRSDKMLQYITIGDLLTKRTETGISYLIYSFTFFH
jgi:hypothetical protein